VKKIADERRGEVNFVASRIGRSTDPRECLGLARQLRVETATALGYLILWEEFILEVGDGRSGRVRGYTAAHIAAKLGWQGQPAKLIKALAAAGILRRQRGTYLHGYWGESITGQYAQQRIELRAAWREKKRRQRAEGTSPVVPETSPGTSPDVFGTSDIDTRRPSGSGPPNPPQGGGSLGQERWAWILKNHESPVNPVACIRYLEAMTDEDWALCQWVVEYAGKPGGPSHSRKKRVMRMDSHKFLATRQYLVFHREWVKKLEARQITGLVAKIEDLDQERRASGRAFMLAQLEDPDVSESEKERIRRRWNHAHPEDPIGLPLGPMEGES
jgi:hypothetical protein